MDDQSFLQLLHDKQPLLWTRAEGDELHRAVEESALLRQSLRSQRLLRERAETVLSQFGYDLEALLAAESAAEAATRPAGGRRKLLLAVTGAALLAVAGVLLYAAATSDEKPLRAQSNEAQEAEAGEPSDDDKPGKTDEDDPTDDPAEPDGQQPSPADASPEGEQPANAEEPPANEPPNDSPPNDSPTNDGPPRDDPVADEPPPPRPYVNGPWDAVAAAEQPPRFAEICFNDFDRNRKTFRKEDLEQWVENVPGHSHNLGETRRRQGQSATLDGLVRLKAPWPDDAWLRLACTDNPRFFIHLYSGREGLTLAHYKESSRMWAAYRTTRAAGEPRPETFALAACDDLRNSRTITGDNGTIMIGWRDGEVFVTRGDLILLRAPLRTAPREVFLDGKTVIEGMELVRTSDVPEPVPSRVATELAKPAEMNWDLERLGEQAKLEPQGDGGVRLSIEKEGEPVWVTAPVPTDGIRAIVFELSDYTAGAGVLLKHQEKGILHTVRMLKNTRTERLTAHLHSDQHTWQQDLGRLEEKRTAEVGDRLWVKLLQGSHMLRCWISANGEHWAELMFPATQHHVPVTGIGLQLVGNRADQRITLHSVKLERLEALHSLASDELVAAAPTLAESRDLGAWLVEVSARQPAEADPAEWRRACALRTVGAGCPKELANALLDSLLDYAATLDLPLERHCDIIDDASLLAYGWENGNEGINKVVGRYYEAGLAAYRRGETDFPFSAVRRRAMSGPYVHYSAPRLSQTPAIEQELLHLLAIGRPGDALRLCEQLQFFDVQREVTLLPWAHAVAQRGAAVEVGSAGIAPLKAAWRHPLEEELSKEAYNLIAELKALLDSNAYVDAARLITMVNPSDTTGVAPSPYDGDLLLSLSAAIHLVLQEHPPLAAAMNAHFADLAELRVKKAIGEGFAPDVILAATQFEPTPAAAEAHRWLGDRALSVGRFQQAIAEYRLALRKAQPLLRREIEPRLRLAAAMLGREVGAPVTDRVQLGSSTVSAAEFEKIVAEMLTRAESESSSVSLEPSSRRPTAVPPPAEWQVEKRGQLDGPQGNDPNASINRHARHLGVPWADRQMALTTVGDTMYIANRFHVAAHRLSDGHRHWQSQAPPGNQLRSQDWPLIPMRPLVLGDRIVVRMLYDVGPQLVCLNRENGQLHWNVPSTRSRLWVSDPVWLRNELLVVAWDHARQQDGFLTLCRFDLQTGEQLQSQPLVRLRDSWFERRTCELAALNDGLLIAAGGVLLKAGAEGEVQWIRRQTLTPPEEHRNWARQHWQPPLVVDDTAYVTQPGVIALEAVATGTGKLRWKNVLPDLRRILGTVEDRLLVECEGRVTAYDRHTGDELWSTPLELPLLDGYLLDDNQLLLAARQVSRGNNKEVYPELLSFDPADGRLLARSVLRELKHQDPQIGSLAAADDRLWLFFGRGSFEVARELYELKPRRELPLLPPPLPAAERVWNRPVDPLLESALAAIAPGWQLWQSRYDTRDNVGYREEDNGRRDLCAVMLASDAPLVIARQVDLAARSRPKLRVVAGADPGRTWKLAVTVDGEALEPREIKRESYGDYWKSIEIDLSSRAGDSGWLTVEMTTENGSHHPVSLERVELVQ